MLLSNSKDLFTVAPVNAHGYPAGGGETEAERQGPYSYVICTVRKVHFDEDERYYTVVRADTQSEQRADPGWMEPIRNAEAVDAAFVAASRTARALAESAHLEAEKRGPLKRMSDAFMSIMFWPARFVTKGLIPTYQRTRTVFKDVMKHVLYGDEGYACRFHFTGINLLVICSFIYLFIEVIGLAFLPARMDYAISIIGL